ncbi:CPBP family intramembrane metalloprotease [Halorussus gelatinilyticus]|uniref:CPBP family intramembrane metalloprotease n=1 Tax=Halorussus gelatinilyticus TaxID=2937524 RepID=A0A8U0IE79_9EURY|nr:CPBP family intramembrane glutamic endopeptidase [Halorussus gelatinilyticus]UPV99207.1 CPBP family intramembrane metalloprotease [Halorussus gelatinilyticus]
MPPAPKYPSFAAVTMLVLGLLIVLARASQAMFEGEETGEDGESADAESRGETPESQSGVPATGAARVERHRDTGRTRAERRTADVLGEVSDDDSWNDGTSDDDSPWGENEAETDARRARDRYEDGELEFSTGALLVNVALSQGVFGAAIVGAAWLADVPPVALGVASGDPWSVGAPAVGVGVVLGLALYAANELSSVVLDATGVEYSEGLRESLAPDTLRGWVVLLGVVLPVIAGFEELLFRAALVGAFAAGFGVSPWLLAVFSTVAFAIGHGAQGPGGVAVTGLLGFALAAAFVLTESLLVVVVAHYLVNALEFGVHEGLDIEWT